MIISTHALVLHANPATRTLSPLDPQVLCAWGGVNSTIMPWAY